MPNTVIVGAQWGDEGKGKVVDVLARTAGWVVRFQGGNNAGHTLVVRGQKVILHLVPSGILNPASRCLIGSGVVVDPLVLARELDQLAARGEPVQPGRLVVTAGAHVILPYHLELDRLREVARGDAAIGTTRKGIGPAYEDRAGRRGIRMGEFIRPDVFRQRLAAVLPEKNALLSGHYGSLPVDLEQVVAGYTAVAERLAPYVDDGVRLLHEALDSGQSILFEGAQGTILDVDHGTYPFVTSSNCVAGAACAGSGVGPGTIDEVVGVVKAYTTRVGAGPFPTELKDEWGQHLRTVGAEFGATTGRPRRCGWFDAALVRYAVRVNGLTQVALTKLDVLSGLESIPVCVAYDGPQLVGMDAESLACAVPRYEVLPGWREDISGCRRYEDLPAACRAYVERLEELMGVRAGLISVGPGREATLLRSPLFRAAADA